MASSHQLIFIGLIHYEKDNKILKKVSLNKIEDSDIMDFLKNDQEYEKNRIKTQKSCFLRKLEACQGYLLALQPQLHPSQVNHTLRGIEDHISGHLPNELPEDEWKQRAIKILLTWNLSEKNEQTNFTQGSDKVEKHYLEFGFLFFATAVIGYVMILVMKHVI